MSNLCQEMDVGPLHRYKRALEELDRVYEITKKLTGYVSSDSDSETGE